MATRTQKSYLGRGALNHIGEILRNAEARSIFLVKDPRAFEASGAGKMIEQAVADRKIVPFSTFSPNPDWPDILTAVEAFRKTPCDLIMAVGGGSSIDIAKLVSLFSLQNSPLETLLRGAEEPDQPILPLMAIPTTAGSGSEATHFAVAYQRGEKHSVAHEQILPRYCVVDPALTDNLPPLWTACSGLDAFCQAVESMWAVGSNEESIAYSRKAIVLAINHLTAATLTSSQEARNGMSEAAHLSGKAINISRTTASHALSYKMTSDLGVPHGHAVAITLGAVMAHNYALSEEDCMDPRGCEYVRTRIREILHLLGAVDIADGQKKISALIKSVGLATSLAAIGVTSPDDLNGIAEGVNTERLGNNPRSFTRESILSMLRDL